MARGKKAKNTERTYKNPNGFGTVYEVKTGNRRKPFVVRVTDGWDIKFIDGKPKKKQKKIIVGYASSYEEGVSMLTKYHKKKQAGIELVRDNATFEDIYKITIERRVAGKSKNLRDAYNAAFKFFDKIKTLPILAIKTGTMQNCIDNTYEMGKSFTTLTNMKSVCKMIFEYSIQNDIIEKDYSKYLKVQQTESKLKRVPFSPEEIKKLWKCDYPYADTILLMIYTGMRINEMLKIKIIDVHLSKRYLITGSKTDAGKDRIIPIAKPIEMIISKLYNKTNKYLISKNSKNINYQIYLNNIWGPLMVKLDMHHLPHDCRHTFCSITDAADINRVVQQKIIGHKGSNVTENIYIHKDLQQLLKEVDRIWPSCDGYVLPTVTKM